MADDLPVAQLTLFRNDGLRSKWLVFKVPLERDWVISETSFFQAVNCTLALTTKVTTIKITQKCKMTDKKLTIRQSNRPQVTQK